MSDSIRKGYSSVYELPSEVRASFDDNDAKRWMEIYNETVKDAVDSKSIENAKFQAWKQMVDAPSSLAIESWASVEVKDSDGELVPIEHIAEHMDTFIKNKGTIHDSHSNVVVGSAWGWEQRKHPETGQDGIVLYFNINHDGEVAERARNDILTGRKRAMSIGAEAPRGGYKCDDRGCYVERDVTDLYEISICETPANSEAKFIAVGKDIAKSKIKDEVIRLHITDDYIHQDYTTCPLQYVKKCLRDKGFKNVHITDEYMVVAKSKKNESRLLKAIDHLGYDYRYNLKKQQFEIMPDYGVEQASHEAIENGWACEDLNGHIALTKKVPEEVFKDWYDRGFIVKIGEYWCIKSDDVAKNIETITVANDDWTDAKCPNCGKVVDEELDDASTVYNHRDGPDGDRYRVTCQNCGHTYDIWHQDSTMRESTKKDAGAMGVGTAGATNAVYGKNIQNNVITGTKTNTIKRRC